MAEKEDEKEKEVFNIDSTVYRGKNDWRSDLLSQARISPFLMKSLQSCSLLENGNLLKDIKQSLKSEQEKEKIDGLLAVLKQLLTTRISQDGNEIPNCYLKFAEALELFLGFDTDYVPGTRTTNDTQRFQHALLHPKYGLSVYLFNPIRGDGGYIIAKSNEIDLSAFLVCFGDEISEVTPKEKRLELNRENIQSLLNSMDSEWDKKVARVILGATHSLIELNGLGIDSNTIDILTNQVINISKECENAYIAANDLVILNLKEQIDKAEAQALNQQHILEMKKSDWPEERILEMQEKLQDTNKHVTNLKNLLTPTTKSEEISFKARCKRKADNLLHIHRLKKRHAGKQG